MRRNTPIALVDSLIEALRAEQQYEQFNPYRVDGSIIGNGSQDFTKTYKSYELDINGVQTLLIDCPGIEGEEGKYRETIEQALKKCHLVCYVARESKGIEVTTLERIRSYLGENVEVIGIHNIPLNPTKKYVGEDYYGEICEQIAKASRNSRNIEKDILSVLPRELYKKTISVAALPGLCATAWRDNNTTIGDPSCETSSEAVKTSLRILCRQQKNFFLHTTPDKLQSASRIKNLCECIVECCVNAPERIKSNSFRRLLQALRKEYLNPIRKHEESLKNLTSKIDQNVRHFVRSVCEANEQLSRNMHGAVKNAVDEFFNTDVLEAIVYPSIERNVGIEKEELENLIEIERGELSGKLESRIKSTVSLLSKEYSERISRYTEELVHGMDLQVASVCIDISCLTPETFGMKKFGEFALNIGGYMFSGGSIGATFGGLFGAVIGVAIGALVGLVMSLLPRWVFKETRINKAKISAKAVMDECAQKMYGQLEPGIKQCVEALTDATKGVVEEAKKKKSIFHEMFALVDKANRELEKIEKSLVDLIAKSNVSLCIGGRNASYE